MMKTRPRTPSDGNNFPDRGPIADPSTAPLGELPRILEHHEQRLEDAANYANQLGPAAKSHVFLLSRHTEYCRTLLGDGHRPLLPRCNLRVQLARTGALLEGMTPQSLAEVEKKISRELRTSSRTLPIHFIKTTQGQIPNPSKPQIYEAVRKILVLSDGTEGNAEHRLGLMIKKAYPDKSVVSSDLESDPKNHVVLDNNKLPFRDGSFDAVVLRRGICVCRGLDTTCGGTSLDIESMTNFLNELSRVLDRSNPNAFALISGPHTDAFSSNVSSKLWSWAARSTVKKYPVNVELLHHHLPLPYTEHHPFWGLRITPRN